MLAKKSEQAECPPDIFVESRGRPPREPHKGILDKCSLMVACLLIQYFCPTSEPKCSKTFDHKFTSYGRVNQPWQVSFLQLCAVKVFHLPAVPLQLVMKPLRFPQEGQQSVVGAKSKTAPFVFRPGWSGDQSAKANMSRENRRMLAPLDGNP